MSKQFKKSVAIVGVTSLIALPVVAKPVMQKITAYLNPAIEYVIDGETALKGTQTINYKNKNYVSVADLSKALGKEVKVAGNKVIISTPEVPELADQVVIAKAMIKEVTANQVTILPEGKTDNRENYIVLNVGDQTLIRHERNKRVYTIKDLEKGMTIKAVHAPIMTASMPPQTPALEIVVLAELGNEVVPPTEIVPPTSSIQNGELEDAIIKEINHSQKYLIVECRGKSYTVVYTNKTKVEFDDDHKKPNANSLKVGQKVDIEIKKGVAVEIDVED